MAIDPRNPSALEISAAPPWYKRPIVVIAAVVSTMMGVSLWSYAMNPEWLGESEESNLLVERILQLNPNLTEEDLARDIQSDNLSFWFGRSDQQYAGVATTQDKEDGDRDRPTVLEEFLKQGDAGKQNRADNTATATAPPTPATVTTTPTADEPATVSTNPGRSALDIAINGVGANESASITPLQRAIDQATAASRAGTEQSATTPTATPTSGVGLNSTTSVYENNTGLPANTVGTPASGIVGGDTSNRFPNNTVVQPSRTRRTTAPVSTEGQPATFTPRSRRESAVPNFNASAYGGTAAPQNVNTVAPPKTSVSNSQRRQSTNFNTGDNYRRVGNGEIESFANPLGQN